MESASQPNVCPSQLTHSWSASALPSQLLTPRAWLRACVINNPTSNDKRELSFSFSVCQIPKDVLPLIRFLIIIEYYLISECESVDEIPVSLHLYFPHIFIHLILPLFPTWLQLNSTFHRHPFQPVHANGALVCLYALVWVLVKTTCCICMLLCP